MNRESLIRYETNSYSVPPEHIGQLLLLKVDPFTSDAEVFNPSGSIRRFALQKAGAKTRQLFPEDQAALRKRWDADRARLAGIRRPRRRSARVAIDVDSRSPAVYEDLFTATAAVAQ